MIANATRVRIVAGIINKFIKMEEINNTIDKIEEHLDECTSRGDVKEHSKIRVLIEELRKQLFLHDVVGRSEQLTCPRCKSTNILNPDKDNDAQCIECAFIWAG